MFEISLKQHIWSTYYMIYIYLSSDIWIPTSFLQASRRYALRPRQLLRGLLHEGGRVCQGGGRRLSGPPGWGPEKLANFGNFWCVLGCIGTTVKSPSLKLPGQICNVPALRFWSAELPAATRCTPMLSTRTGRRSSGAASQGSTTRSLEIGRSAGARIRSPPLFCFSFLVRVALFFQTCFEHSHPSYGYVFLEKQSFDQA